MTPLRYPFTGYGAIRPTMQQIADQELCAFCDGDFPLVDSVVIVPTGHGKAVIYLHPKCRPAWDALAMLGVDVGVAWG